MTNTTDKLREMNTNEHVKVLEPMADTMDKLRELSASLKADAAALRRDGVYRCCAGTYECAAAHIDAIVRESVAHQGEVMNTLTREQALRLCELAAAEASGTVWGAGVIAQGVINHLDDEDGKVLNYVMTGEGLDEALEVVGT